MGFYTKYVFPRLSDAFLDNRRLNAERKKALSCARGAVLEVGFGSGLNLPYYPETVTSLVALDPSEQAFKLATRRIKAASFPITYIPQSCEAAPLVPNTFNCVVSTWTLCTVTDPLGVLRKLRASLAPEGRFLFLEHGRSSSDLVGVMQDCWDPLHQRLCAGCHVNRPIDALFRTAGFDIILLERFNLFPIKVLFSTYRGIAVVTNGQQKESGDVSAG